MDCSFFGTPKCLFDLIVSGFDGVDWWNELRLWGTATLITAIAGVVALAIADPAQKVFDRVLRSFKGVLTSVLPSFVLSKLARRRSTHRTHTHVCRPRDLCPYEGNYRLMVVGAEDDDHSEAYNIYSWPSRGGVVILSNADAVDLNFLALDPEDLDVLRNQDQAEEDLFCQRLLLLGGKWWDGEMRPAIVMEGVKKGRHCRECWEPAPTTRERRFVRVGWPSSGGLWVSECDTPLPVLNTDAENHVDTKEMALWRCEYAAFTELRKARSMDERCDILKDQLGARYYDRLEDYDGYGFLNSWGTKLSGEVGPLMQPEDTVERWLKRKLNGCMNT